MSGEEVFFSGGNVLVTNTRIQFAGGKTFATANITSVWNEVIQPEKPSTGGPVKVIAAGCLGALFGLIGMGGSALGGFMILLLFGAAPIALGILWLRSIRQPEPWHVIKIGSASGEQEGMRATDRRVIAEITEAINKAIVARG